MVSKLVYDLARTLLEEAQLDIESARTQLHYKRAHKAVFDAYQCVEKSMKAALACRGLTYIEGHDPSKFFAVDVVMKADEPWAKDLTDVIHEVAWLMDQYSSARYAKIRARRVVSPLTLYKQEEAEEAIRIAEKSYSVINDFIKATYFKKTK